MYAESYYLLKVCTMTEGDVFVGLAALNSNKLSSTSLKSKMIETINNWEMTDRASVSV